MSENQAKVVDWTEHALDKFALLCAARGDYAEASVIDATIDLYKDGMVTVSWVDGQPSFSLTSEARLVLDVMKGTPEGDMIEDIKKDLEEINNEH